MAPLVFIVFTVSLVSHGVQSCCFPKQFEGLEGLSKGGLLVNGTSVSIKGLFKISLDFSAKKVASSGTFYYNGVPITEQILQDFSAGKQYVVINGKCTPYTLTGEPPSCIPPTAKKVMSTYYGIGKHKINVDMYSYTILNQKIVLTVAPDDGCIPMGQQIEVKNAITDNGFMGLTLGIKDMKVFQIPKACLHPSSEPATQLEMDYMRNRRQSLFVRF